MATRSSAGCPFSPSSGCAFPLTVASPAAPSGSSWKIPQGRRWRLVNTHLDLWSRSRLRQVRSLARLLENAGASRGSCSAISTNGVRGRQHWSSLRRLGDVPPAPPSYPSRWPVFALDRMVVRRCRLEGPLRPHVSELSRRASDHLPVVAEVGPRLREPC